MADAATTERAGYTGEAVLQFISNDVESDCRYQLEGESFELDLNLQDVNHNTEVEIRPGKCK